MKKVSFSSLVLTIVLAVAGCAKHEPAGTLSTTKKDYVGTWKSGAVGLRIDDDGSVVYRAGGSEISKTIDHFEGNNIYFGVGFGNTPELRLRVQSAPATSGGVWKITVEGTELTRVDFGGSDLAAEITLSIAKKGFTLENKVTCPSSIQGGGFDCSFDDDFGSPTLVHITYDAGRDQQDWAIAAAYVEGHATEAFILDHIRGRTGWTATCPSGKFMKALGTSFTCSLTGPEGTVNATVTMVGKPSGAKVDVTLPPVAAATRSAPTTARRRNAVDPLETIGRR